MHKHTNSSHLVVLASVEGRQVKLVQGLGVPQAQVGASGGAEAWDGVVISNSPHLSSEGKRGVLEVQG